MAKRDKKSLNSLKTFCDNSYSGIYGSKLFVNTEKQFDPMHTELGFCYKFTEPGTGRSVYQIECATLGIPDTDFRILMHEYGHIYLGHLDGIHEDLDRRICSLLLSRREELVADLNKRLGIDFADSLVDRVIDDPALNHSLHNIAMDMEVNSSVLSEEDIEEMEVDISSTYPKYGQELQKYLEENKDISEEDKKVLEDSVKKMDDAVKVKLILPSRYELSEGVPFPDDLTYPDYLMLIVQHLDQFVKMLVSLKMGKGLSGNIDLQDLQNVLNNPERDWKNKSKEYKQGYQDALNEAKSGNSGKKENRPNSGSDSEKEDYDQGYQDAISDMTSGNGSQGSGDPLGKLLGEVLGNLSSPGGNDPSTDNNNLGPWKEKESHYTERKNIRPDHSNDSRTASDKVRKVGKIKAGGGIGCGDRGSADLSREVDRDVDAVDMALNEVIKNMRHRVIKLDTKKDLMRNYNRGIVRSVISPAVTRKVTISKEQKIVYLIDVSGSMDTKLVDRILKAIKRNMAHLSRGLKYDIIAWSTQLENHIMDIDPRRSVPRINSGGGTKIAAGIKFFKETYGPESTLIIISDFEDNLNEWNSVEKTMNNYLIYGFNYGTNRWGTNPGDVPWKNLRLKNFT